jgi:hypothetical protein
MDSVEFVAPAVSPNALLLAPIGEGATADNEMDGVVTKGMKGAAR